MSLNTSIKIIKAKGAQPDEFEKRVSKALFDLEMSGSMKSDLSRLYIVAAKEVEVPGGKPAIVCFVPFKLLRAFHTVQAQLIREMEKKFNGQHVLIIAQRQIYGMSYKRRTSN
jgi:small subunit ribosomal protein S7e